MVKIVGIIGSLRPESYSAKALQQVMEIAQAKGAETEILDLRVMNLPFCDASDEYPEYPDVKKLQETVKSADSLILATPEYHGSLSGVLKNALDLMSFEHLSDKVTGLISVLGGQSNSNALNDMRVIVRWVHGFVIPEQVAIGQAWKAFDKEGKLIDQKLLERCDKFVDSLIETTEKLAA